MKTSMRTQWVALLAILVAMVDAALTSDQMFQKRAQYANGVIPITSAEFGQFFNGPRDHHLIAFFTTSNPQFECAACQGFAPVYEILSSSLIVDHSDRPIFFTVVEFEQNQQHFQSINMNTVPHVWVYPPTEIPDFDDDAELETVMAKLAKLDVTSDHYDFKIQESLLGDQKELELQFGNFLSSIIHINIFIHRPFEVEAFLKNFVIYLAVFIILKKRGRKILDRLTNSHVYFLLSCGLIFFSVTGYNFCMQRSVPFIAKDQEGDIMYFSGGSQYQFGLEILNISSLYTLIAGTVIVLVTFVPSVSNRSLQAAVTLVSATLLFFLYSVLNTIFAIKDHEYPFVNWKVF